MTYSYLLSIPLLVTYSVTMAVIKYDEGYKDLTAFHLGVIPKPYALWPKEYKALVLPATICFSVAWSLEIVSHLEELTFWLFLLHQGPSQRDWFTSWEFRTWAVGAGLAVVGMPTITVLLRADPYKSEAWTFFAGGVGSLLITLWFLVVLFKFPKFLKRVRNEGADAEVVVRLTTFDELNRIRVGFRFLFAGPLLVLAIDGVLDKGKPINTSPFWTDLLSMIAGIGCVVSSILTLLIFFPRSIAKEAGYKAKTVSINTHTTNNMMGPQSPTGTYFDHNPGSIGLAVSTSEPAPQYPGGPQISQYGGYANSNSTPHYVPARSVTPSAGMTLASPKSKSPMMLNAPGRYAYGHGGVGSGTAEWELDEVRHPGDIEAYGHQDPREYLKIQSEQSLAHVHGGSTEDDGKRVVTTKSRAPIRPPRPAEPVLHPLIMNYTSPIDLMDQHTRPKPKPRRL
jgi:hypothetical protein